MLRKIAVVSATVFLVGGDEQVRTTNTSSAGPSERRFPLQPVRSLLTLVFHPSATCPPDDHSRAVGPPWNPRHLAAHADSHAAPQ